MAKKSGGQVTLRGRFSPGDVVRLVKAAGAGTLRSEGGEEVDTQEVQEDESNPRVGYVQFTGLEAGERYFIAGHTSGSYLEVRVTGREADDDQEAFSQAPVGPDRVRLGDGTWADEVPEEIEASPVSVGPADIRAARGQQLRSDTPRGEAHPVVEEEKAPKRSQRDVPEGVAQMSDTRAREEDGRQVGGGGEAAELLVGPQRQEDVPDGVQQRSDTPTGYASVIGGGDQVEQALMRESPLAKEARGEPVKAAADPLSADGIDVGAPTGASQEESEERHEELRKSEKAAAALPADQPGQEHDDLSGHDAMGQPAAEDVARASGVEPAEEPRTESDGPDTAPSLKDRGKDEDDDDDGEEKPKRRTRKKD